MSDPIAAAEAAGKARDIANRFETAVFLIAYGIAEKDGLYEADPHRYPYSQAFRHGMNILAALCAECSDDAEELLPTFNESDFIRNSAASDVREWTARWRDECREAVEGCRSIEIGPLASVDGDYFAATSECYEVLRFAENDLLGGHQERRVYEFLRAGTQEQYVYGRRMLIRHPLLTWNEYVRIKTGLALGDAQYKWSARGSKYDSPTAAFCEKTINEYCLLSPGGEAEALASVKYAEALRGCMVQLYKNDMRVNLPAPLHLAEQVEEYIWDWELTGRR